MLGIGTWEFPVNIMGYRGVVRMEITDKGGQYGFALRMPGQAHHIPPVKIMQIAENGNTLNIIARVPQFPGKDIPVSVTFHGDRANGMVKAPFVGTIKLYNGRKIHKARDV